MPVQRTFTPAKAVKTERTHEENQERAYIAASRRSDRSLEARVESARRASEIHKRRTGRSLRVTEQDVINEEMYEEEDDDLPMQYRRLTAHLQTGSADFNRRLAAYLTNQVAMRSALDEAVNSTFAQQYPNAPSFAHNYPAMFPSPLSADVASAPQQQSSPHLIHQSPHLYRKAPYPTPNHSLFKNHHHRSQSSAARQEFENGSPNISTSSAQDPQAHLLQQSSMPATSVPASTFQKGSPKTSLEVPQSSQSAEADDQGARQGTEDVSILNPSNRASTIPPSYSPFSTTLPSESRFLIGQALDPMHPFTGALMGVRNDFYSLYGTADNNRDMKQSDFHPHFGINATLAPSALEMPSSQGAYDTDSSGTLSKSDRINPLDLYGTDFQMFNPIGNSAFASGNATPTAETGWDAFINDSSWNENAT